MVDQIELRRRLRAARVRKAIEAAMQRGLSEKDARTLVCAQGAARALLKLSKGFRKLGQATLAAKTGMQALKISLDAISDLTEE